MFLSRATVNWLLGFALIALIFIVVTVALRALGVPEWIAFFIGVLAAVSLGEPSVVLTAGRPASPRTALTTLTWASVSVRRLNSPHASGGRVAKGARRIARRGCR